MRAVVIAAPLPGPTGTVDPAATPQAPMSAKSLSPQSIVVSVVITTCWTAVVISIHFDPHAVGFPHEPPVAGSSMDTERSKMIRISAGTLPTGNEVRPQARMQSGALSTQKGCVPPAPVRPGPPVPAGPEPSPAAPVGLPSPAAPVGLPMGRPAAPEAPAAPDAPASSELCVAAN